MEDPAGRLPGRIHPSPNKLEWSMRPAFACLLALGLTQCAPPSAGPPAEPPVVAEEAVPDAPFCARPAEKQAFQVAALKSRLMVTALACDSSDKYNAFINANRTALLPQEKTLGGYFQRHYGRRAQTEHDEYITNLANAQSRRRIIDNYRFCSDGQKLYADVATMKTPAEVAALAASRTISQPYNVKDCPETPAPAPRQSRPAQAPARR
jgi:hypothetical protein